MSTITTIQSTDLITNSRADINTNFANLNSDKIETSTLDTDTTLAANSDNKIATQKAVKAYVDAGGNMNASTTQKGIVEEATQAEVDAGTAVGATGARLFINPSSSIGSLKSVTAGETINGATLPVPVYQNKTDNEFYACDGNNTAALKFIGFAVSNGTNGAAMNVRFSGLVSGFTGLAEGEKYYLQDAVGTIGTSVGTYEVLVGIAISETELLIQKGGRYASGSVARTGDGSTTNTVGFRVSMVVVRSVQDAGATMEYSAGSWTVFGGNRGYLTNGGTLNVGTSNSFGINGALNGVVNNITDTSFDLTVSGSAGGTTQVFWEAWGEF